MVNNIKNPKLNDAAETQFIQKARINNIWIKYPSTYLKDVKQQISLAEKANKDIIAVDGTGKDLISVSPA
uniref:Uncharacterized protein n=1 Tax=Rhizophora mucronata TaxID=61149 RepID=A0A2P2Q6Q2_RHIMU